MSKAFPIKCYKKNKGFELFCECVDDFKENCCKYFQFVAELFQEDKDVKAASQSKKKSGSKKLKSEVVAKAEPEVSEEPSILPVTEEPVVAKADTEETADEERKELL